MKSSKQKCGRSFCITQSDIRFPFVTPVIGYYSYIVVVGRTVLSLNSKMNLKKKTSTLNQLENILNA